MGRSSASSAAAMLIVVACAALAFGGCGGGGSKEFSSETYPFSFEYPADWTLTRAAAFNYGAGSGERSVSAALKEPFDQVTITQYKLKKTLPDGINGNQAEVDRIVKRLTREAKGSAGDSKVVKYGGLPGYQYVVEYPGGNGVTLTNELTFLFQGQNEFQINCQSTPANTEALSEGCDQILGSLKFS